jgi:hypothetical protein
MEDKLCVTVIAARRELASTGASARTETRTAGPGTGGGETVVARPSRGRKSGNKPIQTQLPLTIISKGRFDKSEPTKHNGEDLDVPTFIRRGISLN